MAQEAVTALSNFLTPALVMAVLGLSFFFVYFSFKLDQDHFYLKLLSIFFAVISLQALPGVVTSDLCVVTGHSTNVSGAGYSFIECYELESSTAESITKITGWFFNIFVTYIAIYIFWNFYKNSERFLKRFNR
jgi:hypothetical protein